MKAELDHLVVVARTLEAGVAWCEATLGVTPAPGGAHAWMGTHNRLLALADGLADGPGSGALARSYLEIIAIDPQAEAPARPRWFGMDGPAPEPPCLRHWVARCANLDMQRWGLVNLGFNVGPSLPAQRGSLRWRLTVPDDGALLAGGAIPTLIEWAGPHPSDSLPASGVTLQSLTVRGLGAAAAQVLRPRGITLREDAGPTLEAVLQTPRGPRHPDEHPMTEELFREDATLTQARAEVRAVAPDGLQLDRTVFYPQGGGQAGDAGQFEFDDGTRLAIVDTRKDKATGALLHVPAPGQEALLAALVVGQLLTARIDTTRRTRHMRFHTATHLLCALIPKPVDGCSITADYARLDFHMAEPLDKAELGAGLARLVAAAHPVAMRWITEAELDANPGLVRSMSVQPPRGSGRVRLIDIEGVDLQPCGGTHVANTAEIGNVIVTKIEKKSAMTRRVVLGFADPP